MEPVISLTVAEYAAYAGVTAATVYRWRDDGVPLVHGAAWNAPTGRRLRVDVQRAAYESWKASQKAEAAP